MNSDWAEAIWSDSWTRRSTAKTLAKAERAFLAVSHLYFRLTPAFHSRLIKLVQNYRSHPKILEFPNRKFYRGELQACAAQSKSHRVVGRWNGLVDKDCPIVFHSVRGEDRRDKHSPSYFNPDEISVVKEQLLSLLGDKKLNLREYPGKYS